MPNFKKPTDQFFCSKPWVGFEVENDGTVSPCCMAKIACGNVNEHTISELWNGPSFQDFRRKMAAGQWQETCRPECPRLYGEVTDEIPSPISAEFDQNYRTNAAEIASRALVLKSWPLIWKTTDSTLCNLDCIMCYQDRNDRRTLPGRFYEELKLIYAYIQEIQVIGGEPFTIRRLRNLMAEFDSDRYPDVRFSIVSNGTVYDKKTLDIVRRLRVSWMSISIDAATESTYARVRRKGDFNSTVRGVRTWIALGAEMGFPVHVSFTAMNENMGEMYLFAELVRDLGIDCLFGKVSEPALEMDPLDESALQAAVARTRSVIEPVEDRMPFANLTLATLAAT